MSENATTTNEAPAAAPEKKARKPRKDKGTKKAAPKAKPAKAPKAKPAKAPKAKKAAKPKADGTGIVSAEYLERYETVILQDEKAGKKSRTIDNGDALSKKLRGEPIERLYKLASEASKLPQTELRAKYEKLNPGQQAMNLRNRIRAAVARGEMSV
jgi:hypothetical protein